MFGKFKAELNYTIASSVVPGTESVLDMYQFCAALRDAYYKSFTRVNILASFKRSGLWPLDPSRFLQKPLPRDVNDIGTLVGKAELTNMMTEKRIAARRDMLGDDVTVAQCGFVNTVRGAVLNSMEALEAAQQNANEDEKKRQVRALCAMRKELRSAMRADRVRAEADRMKEAAWLRRAKMAGASVCEFKARTRSIRARRAAAKIRTRIRRQAQGDGRSSLRAVGAAGAPSSSGTLQDSAMALLAGVAIEQSELAYA